MDLISYCSHGKSMAYLEKMNIETVQVENIKVFQDDLQNKKFINDISNRIVINESLRVTEYKSGREKRRERRKKERRKL